jgi:transcriptional regulator with XRE-family HTH domain
MKKAVNPPRKPGGGRKRSPTAADSQVGASIRAHRLLASMSQDHLAQRLGVSFQQIQKYEKGMNRVGAGRLPLIAEIFGVPVGALFGGTASVQGGAVPAKLMTDSASVRLLTAFADVTDKAIRRNISELVELMASRKKKPRGGRK